MQPEFDHALDTLSDWVRDSDSFTEVVGRWAGTPVQYVPLHQEIRALELSDLADADDLGMRLGTQARLRDGRLQITAWGEDVVFARVSATIAQHRLPPEVRRQLDETDLPLGAILKRNQVRRHTLKITRPDQYTERDNPPLMQVRALLTLVGRPIAVVRETVHEKLMQHRATDPRTELRFA
ncbi:hypothetical protein ALI22I_20555 [Saccharothrix sp. ALI-22-I]|nr:hypothetical protein ALI22I_20555 [Saccharothrix sp. ALI-22-I]